MRRLAVVISLMLLAAPADLALAQSSDAGTVSAINAASAALHEAFAAGDAKAIRSHMTDDHIAVTPYYDGPQTVDGIIATLSDVDFTEMIEGEASVALLAPDVALRTFAADWKGSFDGKPLPARVYVSEILVNRNGAWTERYYQVTSAKP
jgi:ketosteroid isomerase-like protein